MHLYKKFFKLKFIYVIFLNFCVYGISIKEHYIACKALFVLALDESHRPECMARFARYRRKNESLFTVEEPRYDRLMLLEKDLLYIVIILLEEQLQTYFRKSKYYHISARINAVINDKLSMLFELKLVNKIFLSKEKVLQLYQALQTLDKSDCSYEYVSKVIKAEGEAWLRDNIPPSSSKKTRIYDSHFAVALQAFGCREDDIDNDCSNEGTYDSNDDSNDDSSKYAETDDLSDTLSESDIPVNSDTTTYKPASE